MPAQKDRSTVKIRREQAILAAVHLPSSTFDERDPLGELRSLAETAGATVVGELIQSRQQPEAGTFIGTGKLEELGAMAKELRAGVIIFDHELSPKQIANIEKATSCKVLDRSELILDIFASRATTKQARMSVELAQLEYTYPRLRAMWDHLERIVGVGGIGGVGTRGPGEQQIEIDRRLVQKRKLILRRELQRISDRKTREVAARNVDHVTVGLVGYTNAGKSTLFNTLTTGGAFANDQLFATLMTRTREWNLGGGESVMLSDTVGFIRDLPHHLIASFKATLEEATSADLLLIVLDVADPAAELHYHTVQSTLDELFDERKLPEADRPERLLLLNKADALRDNAPLLVWTQRYPGAIPLCAKDPKGVGQDELYDRVRAAARGPVRELRVTLPLSEGKAVDTIEKRAEVLDRVYDNGSVTLLTRIGERQLARLRSSGARFDARTPAGDRFLLPGEREREEGWARKASPDSRPRTGLTRASSPHGAPGASPVDFDLSCADNAPRAAGDRP
jgi:GTPase